MTYYRRKIQRLWNGYASLKDYEVKKAIAKGGAVLSLNKTKKQKSGNRRIQITFINPPHHGKGRSGTDYQEVEK